MNSQTHDKTLAKIRAILAKAEDPAASPEEAQAYFAKAADLMSKYGIERAMLAEKAPETDKPAQRVLYIKGTYLLDRTFLLGSIVKALGGQSIRWRVYDRESGKYVQKFKMYGYESMLERAEMLYTSLLLQAFNGMKQGRPQPGESTTSYRKAWLTGFRYAVKKRLERAEQVAVEEADLTLPGGSASTALVLAQREDTIRAIFTAQHPKVRPAAKRNLRGSGWRDGDLAGQRADLGSKRLNDARKSALAS
ncbi:DUF2786 domain-containing protein [Streptomyces sp. WZ.A104]|uniref:DUF2786 domain-containing protein n=1 Tax=Streptomyces sp. WZ.A104 TaxID=2023771 RepID=UPI0015CEDE4D|nr:DUF2786 domain-containing protein [Streptomyces sp. WZ.A104]